MAFPSINLSGDWQLDKDERAPKGSIFGLQYILKPIMHARINDQPLHIKIFNTNAILSKEISKRFSVRMCSEKQWSFS